MCVSVLASAAAVVLWHRCRGSVEGIDRCSLVRPVAGLMERWDAHVFHGTVTVQRFTRPVGTDPESVTADLPVRWRHYRTSDVASRPFRYGLENVGWRRGQLWQSGWAVTGPFWPLPVLTVMPAAAVVAGRVAARRRRRVGRCRRCGYDLRATPGRCPECGAAGDASAGGAG